MEMNFYPPHFSLAHQFVCSAHVTCLVSLALWLLFVWPEGIHFFSLCTQPVEISKANFYVFIYKYANKWQL